VTKTNSHLAVGMSYLFSLLSEASRSDPLPGCRRKKASLKHVIARYMPILWYAGGWPGAAVLFCTGGCLGKLGLVGIRRCFMTYDPLIENPAVNLGYFPFFTHEFVRQALQG